MKPITGLRLRGWDSDLRESTVRETLVRCILEAALEDERITLLCGDHGYALFDEFRRALPDRFLNCGIAEQNMIGVASGMAKAGLRPVVYGLASFIPMRVLEQIKLDVCYENRRVIFLGDGAGLVYAQLGISHQCCEDVAAMRALQNLAIFSAADRFEMEACVRFALGRQGPTYLRIGKGDLGDVHERAIELTLGELCELRSGGGALAWLATGSMVKRTLSVAQRWPGSAVWSVPCLKPVDCEQVRRICQRHRVVITVEEHVPEGGLGSLVSEIASESGQTRVCRIGVENPFLNRCGSYDYLLKLHGMGVEEISARVGAFLEAESQVHAAWAA
jgi:transketolase